LPLKFQGAKLTATSLSTHPILYTSRHPHCGARK
jgi:hypothetical protein